MYGAIFQRDLEIGVRYEEEGKVVSIHVCAMCIVEAVLVTRPFQVEEYYIRYLRPMVRSLGLTHMQGNKLESVVETH